MCKTSTITVFSLLSICMQQTLSKWQNHELCGQVGSRSALLGPGSELGVRVPWTATFTIRSWSEEPDRTHAAIIISPNMVLTFANKLIVDGTTRFQIFNYSQYIVSVGSTKFGDPVHVDPTAKTVGVTHISIHPSFEPGPWTTMKSDLALIHLKEPLSFSDKIVPICIPTSHTIENPSSSEDLVLSGWNRGLIENIFLRFSIKSREKCEQLWKINVTMDDPYENKFCGLVGQENNHAKCIHRGVVSARPINGSYYMAGAISNFFGLTDPFGEESRTCDPNTLYYFDSYLNDGSFSWIENSERCGPNSFSCHNGQCVKLSDVCNRKFECSDQSDEESKFCRGLNFCKDGLFACGVYGDCIPNDKVNDGVEDCEDGEDETLPEKTKSAVWIWMGVSGAVVIVAGISLFGYICILRNKIRNLTQEEINEFFQGSDPEPLDRYFEPDNCSLSYIHKPRSDSGPVYVNDYIQVMPWTLDNEIPLHDIEFLGEINRGNFGIIHKARILHNAKITKDLVAAKTHKSNVSVEDFKMLLCELKILAYVGSHDNIISFIGACTENIKKRSVYLVMEYCPLGDLRNYMISNSIGFENLLTPSTTSTTYYIQLSTMDAMEGRSKLNSLDLVKWSSQIAQGMEHLAAKKIIHGDLSTRNILLTTSRNCKISDFGLSHRLGRSGVYVKTSMDSIPWKWMSLETLQYNWYTELSDVWSMGVTLWEVFSMGDVPYKTREFSRVFVQELLGGYRLPCPNYANEEIYNLMMSCWEEKPEHRPTMASINQGFTNVLERYTSNNIQPQSSESIA